MGFLFSPGYISYNIIQQGRRETCATKLTILLDAIMVSIRIRRENRIMEETESRNDNGIKIGKVCGMGRKSNSFWYCCIVINERVL
jgi:hypothetical protein